MLVDENGQLRHANPAARRWLDSIGLRAASRSLLDGIEASCGPEQRAQWEEALARAKGGERVRFEMPFGARHFDISVHAAASGDGAVAVFARDVTARVEANRRQQELQKQLVTASRLAGMAEMASGVLHNIGNVLNSVNVSTAALRELGPAGVQRRLERLLSLLEEQDDLAGFLGSERGRQVLPYLRALAAEMQRIEQSHRQEVERLAELTAHMAAIIGAQQRYARGGQGAREPVRLPELIGTVTQLIARSLERHGIAFETQIEDVEMIVDRHRVLQILVNLVENAKDAVREAAASGMAAGAGRIDVTARREAQRVVIEVKDTGCGIEPEHLERIFSHGFTTKPHGHGFGLHSAANAATELGGELRARSEGRGRGATFVLTLPLSNEGAASSDHTRSAA
ncbi:MAG: GHKL domain-containing protein [Planctomycetota bacterium]|nr:MAG: GHKL domain-containing protein [Planctomycetota bacterium]